MVLTSAELQSWNEDGYLVSSRVIDPVARESLQWWVSAIAKIRPGADDPNPVMQHFEATPSGDVLARSENFVPRLTGLQRLITEGPLPDATAALLGEPVVLYKEKINYKLPGGAGFEPHQDATAYKFVDQHITCMIAVDRVTELNGCLEVAAGYHKALLETDGDGCIAPSVAAELSFSPVVMEPGDVLWFHSRTPHRSADNQSDVPRRALFLTFNAAASGDLRTAYYQDKIRQLRDYSPQDSAEGRSRVSTIGHFRGREPNSATAADTY